MNIKNKHKSIFYLFIVIALMFFTNLSFDFQIKSVVIMTVMILFVYYVGVYYIPKFIDSICSEFKSIKHRLIYCDIKEIQNSNNYSKVTNFIVNRFVDRRVSFFNNLFEVFSPKIYGETCELLSGVKTENDFINEFDKNFDEGLILYLNICHFSELNIIFGYKVGNDLLRSFANRLKENYYNIYRIHGDEFAIVTPMGATSLEIDTFANYVFDLICKEPYHINENEIFLTVHMGIVVIDNQATLKNSSLSQMLYNASFAMKFAKEKKIQYAVYGLDFNPHSEETSGYFWKKNLITTIKNHNFLAVYQPIVDNKTEKTIKYEALIRIKNDKNELTMPHKFLNVSKEYGLYNHLTKFMISDVFENIVRFDCQISINISINDIKNLSTLTMLFNRLKETSREYTKNITFELLESEGIENYEEVRVFINEVKKYECKIAIDDFGSGYSNFGYILNLDIDYIKIDAQLIKNINNDKNAELITRLIVNFSKSRGIKTIAEFVHSKEVFEKVKELGIDYSQGFYFSEPINMRLENIKFGV